MKLKRLFGLKKKAEALLVSRDPAVEPRYGMGDLLEVGRLYRAREAGEIPAAEYQQRLERIEAKGRRMAGRRKGVTVDGFLAVYREAKARREAEQDASEGQ